MEAQRALKQRGTKFTMQDFELTVISLFEVSAPLLHEVFIGADSVPQRSQFLIAVDYVE